jgi:hypothetical protein
MTPDQIERKTVEDIGTSMIVEGVRFLIPHLPKYPKRKRQGPFRIQTEVVKAGEQMTLTSYRQLMYEGLRPIQIRFDKDYQITSLYQDGFGMWMSTKIQELGQMVNPFYQSYGKVLVGGLGLGVFPHLIQVGNLGVRKVVVVEIQKDLIELIQPYIDPKIEIVHDDLFHYLKRMRGKFNFAFFDIWQTTGEWSWTKTVVPLRRLAAKRNIEELACWQEKEMQGQVETGLFRWADIPEEEVHGMRTLRHRWVFRMAAKKYRPKGRVEMPGKGDSTKKQLALIAQAMEIENENKLDENLQRLVRLYVDEVGSPEWEQTFGAFWDEAETWKLETEEDKFT